MKRNEFMKRCATGVCGCGVLGFLAPLSAQTQGGQAQASTVPTDSELLKRQLDFVHERFANLISIMGENIDNAIRDKILQRLGYECAQEASPLFQKYRGDLQGFLAAIKTRWVERTEYDETTGILRVIGKVRPCVCPLAKAGRTPADFCTCTRGWNQFAFSTVLGKPVTVELEESVLRGGSRCTHRIIGVKG
jgi:hypothetical protein